MRKTFFPVLAAIGLVFLLNSCAQKSVRIPVAEGMLFLEPLTEDAVRVRVIPDKTEQLEELIFTENVKPPKARVKRSADGVTLQLPRISVEYRKASGTLVFRNADGKVILEEKCRSIQTAEVQGLSTYEVSQAFLSPEDEHIYGTGQFQDGYLDIRGLTRRLTQVNTQISLPMILSSKGYGLLWHNYGLTDFNPADRSLQLELVQPTVSGSSVSVTGNAGSYTERRWFSQFQGTVGLEEEGEYALLLDSGQQMSRKQYLAVNGEVLVDYSNLWLPPTVAVKAYLPAGPNQVEVQGSRGDAPVLYLHKITDETTFHSPVAQGIDYTVFAGGADEVMHAFRTLSGPVPELPDWAFRYIHCRERYNTQEELLTAARRFHEEGYPVGTIVQDWQWWGKYDWNAMQFDEDKYPDPAAMVEELHGMDQHLMLSVWSRVGKNCDIGREMEEKGYYLEGTDWVDFFQPDAARLYWDNFRERLLPVGIDAWWQDATEPENDDLAGRKVGPDGGVPGELYRNVYPLKVIQTVYEGLRQDQPERLPVILTRSAYPGIQRYGAITWSGDVGNDWGTLRRQIAGGLGQMAAGLPWWTYDAGGFFRPGDQYTNADYQECMIRWIQTAVYLPFMRVHGYMSRTEPWEYLPETERLFKKAVQEREALLPYIRECARRVSEEDYTLMRPLVFDFPADEEALRQDCEYMFGPDYLVCPVTEPGVSEWKVYLPQNEAGWEDIRNGKRLPGGGYHTLSVNLEAIPVFKRL